MPPSNQPRILLAVAGTWAVLIALGMGVLIRYSLAPGREGHPPPVWPAASERPAGQYTLVLAAHPHCPCTRATLSELATIMTRCRGRLLARVLFVEPEGFSDAWAKSDLWHLTEAIPGAQPVLDPKGLEARRFGACNSGQVALYDPDGQLVFSGGITGARGHAGSNAGRDAVLARVQGREPTHAQAPVFGCSLEGPAAERSHGPSQESHSCPDS